jgi:hypothetical protein
MSANENQEMTLREARLLFQGKDEKMTFDEIDHTAIEFVRHTFRFVDDQRRILHEIIDRDMKHEGDSELLPYAEYFAGMAFAVGQRYITSVHGFFKRPKGTALAIGEEIVSGVTYARLINATANFWKHGDEWNFENLRPLELETRRVIETIGVSIVDAGTAVASNVLEKLGFASCGQLLPKLTAWSKAVSDSVA